MITFNLQARNGNYYSGHEVTSDSQCCWTGKKDHALSFTIEQAQRITNMDGLTRFLEIVISPKGTPITGEVFNRELFCLNGGNWYDYKKA